jgi:hypothetical protein
MFSRIEIETRLNEVLMVNIRTCKQRDMPIKIASSIAISSHAVIDKNDIYCTDKHDI